MSKQMKFSALLLVLLITISACGAELSRQAPLAPQSGVIDAVTTTNGAFAVDEAAAGEGYLYQEDGVIQTEQEQDGQQAQAGDTTVNARVILMDAALSLVVDDATTKVNEIRAMALEMGGWVVSSSTSVSTNSAAVDVVYGNIVVRVPSDRLYEAMERIKTGVGRIVYENVSGQDVTQDYVDTTSTVANLEATEQQLQTIMDSARTTEDVLSVQRELTRVRGEIEIARGRLRYYDEASAFSSITISLSPPDAPIIQSDNWSPQTTAERAFDTLLRLLRGLVDTVITLVIVPLPLLVLFGVPAWFLWRRFRPRRAQPNAPATPAS